MIEPKDASTCDERRVKNKLNLLTHKKKGETHTMGIQGMKSWKLGAFFVISLMLVAGLFTNTASAQTVTVQPEMVTAQEVIGSVIVTYTVTGAAIDVQNEISVGLPDQEPERLGHAAYANDGQ